MYSGVFLQYKYTFYIVCVLVTMVTYHNQVTMATVMSVTISVIIH